LKTMLTPSIASPMTYALRLVRAPHLKTTRILAALALTGLALTACVTPDCGETTSPPGSTPPVTPTTVPATPTATAAPTPVSSCGTVSESSWIQVLSNAELRVQYADVQPQFGSCVAVRVTNEGADKSSWAVYMNVGVTVESLSYFEGGSVALAGNQLTLRPTVGQALASGASTSICYCTNPGRAYPNQVLAQYFPGQTGTYTGLPTTIGTFTPTTLVDAGLGVTLDATPVQDVRGPVGSCANLTFTNTTASALNLDKVLLTLNGSGVSPQFWPDFVTGNEGGSEITIDFPNSWMPLEAGKSLPITLCMGGRMPAQATYTLGN